MMLTVIAVVVLFGGIYAIVHSFPRSAPAVVNDCCDDRDDNHGVPDDGVDYKQYFVDDGGPIFGD